MVEVEGASALDPRYEGLCLLPWLNLETGEREEIYSQYTIVVGQLALIYVNVNQDLVLAYVPDEGYPRSLVGGLPLEMRRASLERLRAWARDGYPVSIEDAHRFGLAEVAHAANDRLADLIPSEQKRFGQWSDEKS